MPAESKLPLHPHIPPPQDSRTLCTTTHSRQLSSSAAPASIKNARPQREAAKKARKRVEDSYTLYPFEQDSDSDGDATLTRPSAPRPIPVHWNDSSDSDTFVDDSDWDCPSPNKSGLGKKRKRTVSSMMNLKRGREIKAEIDDRESEESAMGFLVESGNVVRDVLLGKAGRASREYSTRQSGEMQGSGECREIRRAGLSDMSADIGTYMSSRRDKIWTKTGGDCALESSDSAAKAVVGADGCRVSRFFEHV